MVVLAMMAVLAAVSWPALRRPLNKSYLQDGAQQLSKTLVNVRLAAMEQGRTYLFRYQTGAARFQSLPAELQWLDAEPSGSMGGLSDLASDPSYSSSLSYVGATSPTGDEQLDDPNNQDEDSLDENADTIQVDQLPDGVQFSDPSLDTEENIYAVSTDVQAAHDRGLTETPEESAPPASDSSLDPQPWSLPILFYPDGRATNATLVLVSDDGYQVQVNLRGLTGTVRVGPLQRREVASWDEENPQPPSP